MHTWSDRITSMMVLSALSAPIMSSRIEFLALPLKSLRSTCCESLLLNQNVADQNNITFSDGKYLINLLLISFDVAHDGVIAWTLHPINSLKLQTP